ncbi:DUF6965 family protein [Flavobacterium hauense]
MTPEEIKRYFLHNPPPEEVDWKPYMKIANSQGFLNHTFVLIHNHKGKLEDCPAWWRLREFYQDMKKLNEAAQ